MLRPTGFDLRFLRSGQGRKSSPSETAPEEFPADTAHSIDPWRWAVLQDNLLAEQPAAGEYQLTGIVVTVLLASLATQISAPSKAKALGLLPTE